MSSRVLPPVLYWGSFAYGKVSDLELVPLSLDRPNFIAYDLEIAADNWETIFITYRSTRDRRIMEVSFARWDGQRYVLSDNWQRIMANVNTDGMEYAPEVSSDLLELWFTRVIMKGGPMSVIFGATRNNVDEPFTNVGVHPSITGPAEAPTLTADDNTMYYHCMDVSTKTWEVCVTRRQ